MKKKLNTIALVALISLFTSLSFASNTSGEQDLATFSDPLGPGVDPGNTPIDDYLIPMLLLGVALGYCLVKKKTQEV